MVTLATKPGRLADGGNLYLSITKTGAKSWVFLYTIAGRQREKGLGSALSVPLAEARKKAADCRALLAGGGDPLEGEKAVTAISFGTVANELIASRRPGWRNVVHARQWQTTLETYCAPIWCKPVREIALADVLGVLTPLWQRVPETGRRLRSRIELVLDAAKARGLRSGENVARWRGNLEHLLPRAQKLEQSHHPAMPYQNVSAFVAELRQAGTVPALAIEFLILTAARLGEVCGADADEVDLTRGVWAIPARRTKAGRAHIVPLSERALEIVRDRTSGRIFLTSPSSMRKFLPADASFHGFRSSFRDWAGDRGVPREVAEGCLAHLVGGAVERAYRRGDDLERRRQLLEAWARYLGEVPVEKVVPLAARKG
jgi:integrase